VATPPYAVEFSESNAQDVLRAMRDKAGGQGWLNFQPQVPEEHEHQARGMGSAIGVLFGAIFGARGPAVPLCTWVPMPGDRPPHVEIGIQHARGTRAAQQLAEAGCPVPEAWRVLGDHPKRGLVVAVPVDADHGEVLHWLMAAGQQLSTVPLTGRWTAGVFTK
jgi:hypothetical protein